MKTKLPIESADIQDAELVVEFGSKNWLENTVQNIIVFGTSYIKVTWSDSETANGVLSRIRPLLSELDKHDYEKKTKRNHSK